MLQNSLLSSVLKHRYQCSENIEKHLNYRLKRVQAAKGEVLQQPNDICKRLYFVESGCVRIYTVNEGQEQTLDFACTGEFCTLSESFVHQQKSVHGLCCESDCQLYVLNYHDLMALCEEVSEFMQLSNRMLTAYILHLQQQCSQERHATALQRYAALHQRHPDLLKHAKQKHLASYLDIAPQSFTRLLKQYLSLK